MGTMEANFSGNVRKEAGRLREIAMTARAQEACGREQILLFWITTIMALMKSALLKTKN